MFKSATTSELFLVESPEMTLLATANGGGRGGLKGEERGELGFGSSYSSS